MKVDIEEFVATSAADSRREVRPNLWRVRVDGMHAGFIPRPVDSVPKNCKLLLHLRFSNAERAEIEKQVSEHFGEALGSVQPAELQDAENEEPDLLEDFD